MVCVLALSTQLSDRDLGGAVDGDEEIELALRGLHFGDVDMEEADWIGLELALGGSFALDLGQLGGPWRLRHRCSDERVRCGMVGCRA